MIAVPLPEGVKTIFLRFFSETSFLAMPTGHQIIYFIHFVSKITIEPIDLQQFAF